MEHGKITHMEMPLVDLQAKSNMEQATKKEIKTQENTHKTLIESTYEVDNVKEMQIGDGSHVENIAQLIENMKNKTENIDTARVNLLKEEKTLILNYFHSLRETPNAQSQGLDFQQSSFSNQNQISTSSLISHLKSEEFESLRPSGTQIDWLESTLISSLRNLEGYESKEGLLETLSTSTNMQIVKAIDLVNQNLNKLIEDLEAEINNSMSHYGNQEMIIDELRDKTLKLDGIIYIYIYI